MNDPDRSSLSYRLANSQRLTSARKGNKLTALWFAIFAGSASIAWLCLLGWGSVTLLRWLCGPR